MMGLHIKSISFFLLLFWLGSVYSYGSIPNEKEECPENVTVPCPCGKRTNKKVIQVPVKSCAIPSNEDGKIRCVPCYKEILKACIKYINCSTCIENKNGSFSCVKSSYKASVLDNIKSMDKKLKEYQFTIQKNATRTNSNKIPHLDQDLFIDGSMREEIVTPSGFPIEFKLRPGHRSNHRSARQAPPQGQAMAMGAPNAGEHPASCVPSAGFDTAEVHCWIWPDHVKCRETCIHGYKIHGRNEITSKCFDRNPGSWRPHALGECQPYVNCQAELISPGNLTCYALTMEPPVCYISCKSYDEHHELPRRKYTCNEDFDPPLPFCAKLALAPEVENNQRQEFIAK